MKYPPSRYRMITENLSISGPLTEASARFLHDSGCRKIITLPGGFVSSDVVITLKQRKMEVEHFPLELHLPKPLYTEQLDRVLNKITHVLNRGSRLHLVSSPEMIEAGCIVGLLRQEQEEWDISAAAAEALDISRFAESEAVLDVVLNSARDLKKK